MNSMFRLGSHSQISQCVCADIPNAAESEILKTADPMPCCISILSFIRYCKKTLRTKAVL